MRRLLQSLEESEIVIVPTDKTNRFRSMKKEEYNTMVGTPQTVRKRDIERKGNINI